MERRFAYTDTLGDLGLGTLGAALAAVAVHQAWRRSAAAPQDRPALAAAEPRPTR